MAESYVSMEKIMLLMNYCLHNWLICGHLKDIAIFWACWEVIQNIPASYVYGTAVLMTFIFRKKFYQNVMFNVTSHPLVSPQKIIFPPLYIKLSIMKSFVKALDKSGAGFLHLRDTFPRVS